MTGEFCMRGDIVRPSLRLRTSLAQTTELPSKVFP